jgi:hypothetical protein
MPPCKVYDIVHQVCIAFQANIRHTHFILNNSFPADVYEPLRVHEPDLTPGLLLIHPRECEEAHKLLSHAHTSASRTKEQDSMFVARDGNQSRSGE